MKKILKISVLLFTSIILFTACPHGNQPSGNGGNGGSNKKDSTALAKFGIKPPAILKDCGITYNFERAKAVLRYTEDDQYKFVKLMDDDSVNDIFTFEEDCKPNFHSVLKSPVENSKDIYILGCFQIGMENKTETTEEGVTITRSPIPVYTGNFLCLHEDGTIVDILQEEREETLLTSSLSVEDYNVVFDSDGNVIFKVTGRSEYLFLKFNPKTNECTQFLPGADLSHCQRFQLDKNNEYFFAYTYNLDGSHFLRAYPVNNPNAYITILEGNMPISDWIYDDKTEQLFVSYQIDKEDGLFVATKANGFKDLKHYRTFAQEETYKFENKYFKSFDLYQWNTGVWTVNSSLTFDDTLKTIKDALKQIYIGDKEIDVRFDKYAGDDSAPDCLQALAVMTKGKKNVEALEALNNKAGRSALARISSWYAGDEEEGCEHNFLADIIYIKDTNTLLDEFDNTIFAKNEKGNYINNDFIVLATSDGMTYEINQMCYDFKLSSDKMLELFFSLCDVEGEKEFRLTELSKTNISGYDIFETDLTDEEALDWIRSDGERMERFGQIAGLKNAPSDNNGYDIDYNRFMTMISKTCFIKGTDTKALSRFYRHNAYNIITYYPDAKDPEIPRDSYCRGIEFFLHDSGIYCALRGYYGTQGRGWNPMYFVQITDEKGELVENINEFEKNTSEQNEPLLIKGDWVIMEQVGVDSRTGNFNGKKALYAAKLPEFNVIDCLENVPNNTSITDVHYAILDDDLYLCAKGEGFIENGYINLNTNEYTPLNINEEISIHDLSLNCLIDLYRWI